MAASFCHATIPLTTDAFPAVREVGCKSHTVPPLSAGSARPLLSDLRRLDLLAATADVTVASSDGKTPGARDDPQVRRPPATESVLRPCALRASGTGAGDAGEATCCISRFVRTGVLSLVFLGSPHLVATAAAAQGGRIHGRVLDPDGRPVAGATVIVKARRPRHALSVQTPEGGFAVATDAGAASRPGVRARAGRTATSRSSVSEDATRRVDLR